MLLHNFLYETVFLCKSIILISYRCTSAGIIGEEMNKISKITTRSTLASAYIEDQKTRGKDEITENLGKKMYGAITSFKEKYTMIQPNREQLLMSIKM